MTRAQRTAISRALMALALEAKNAAEQARGTGTMAEARRRARRLQEMAGRVAEAIDQAEGADAVLDVVGRATGANVVPIGGRR